MDILETIFKLQKELATVIASERYPRIKEERISALAIVHEAVEVQNLTNWKWWKKPIEFDQVQARGINRLVAFFHTDGHRTWYDAK